MNSLGISKENKNFKRKKNFKLKYSILEEKLILHRKTSVSLRTDLDLTNMKKREKDDYNNKQNFSNPQDIFISQIYVQLDKKERIDKGAQNTNNGPKFPQQGEMHKIRHSAKASQSKTKKTTPDVQYVNYWKPKMKGKSSKQQRKTHPLLSN